MKNKICIQCKNTFKVHNNRIKTAKYCSIKCKAEAQKNMPQRIRDRISATLKMKGIKPPSRWIENPTNYSTIHKWLLDKFGTATKCESKTCNGKSKNYQYALNKGKNYERKRENFKMLCASCHRKYDMTKKTKSKIIKNLKSQWKKNTSL